MRLGHVAVVALLLTPLVLAGAPPSVPRGFEARTGIGVGEIDLNWTAPLSSGSTPVAGYRVYRSLTPGGLTHLVDLGNVLTFTDTGIPDGAPRYYRVSAVNGDGEGPLTAAVSAIAKAAPTAPRSVSAQPLGRGNISISWILPQYNGTADVFAYNVYRGAVASGPFDFIANVPASSHLDTGHVDNATFFYRVSAVNIYGEGTLSDARFGHSPRRPGTPPNLTASSFPVFGVTLLWDDADDGGDPIIRYHVYRTVANGVEDQIGVTTAQNTVFTDRDCPLLQECHYRIRARNSLGYSDHTPRVTGLGDSPPIID